LYKHRSLEGWASLALLVVIVGSPVAAQAADRPAPDWVLADAAGTEVRLSAEIREKPQIILFWATWCPFCRALMPHIESVLMEYGDAIGVLAVNIMEDGDPAEYLAKSGYDFRLLPAGEKVADLYGVKGTPGLFLVDTAGRIRFDLSRLPRLSIPESEAAGMSRREFAGRMAPYWAAELRKAIDAL